MYNLCIMNTKIRRSTHIKQFFAIVIQLCILQSYGVPQGITLAFDATMQGDLITNKGSDINFWDLSSWQHALPENYYATYFPFVKRVQLMAGTYIIEFNLGGSIYTRKAAMMQQ